MATDAHYYLTYLFGRIYHTGILGYVAVVGLFVAGVRRNTLAPQVRFGLTFVLLWMLGLLLILSLWPVSIRPLIFVPKQTNYMLILVAPLCLLGGWALSLLPTRWVAPLATAVFVGGLLVALLLQGSVAVFTANSSAALRYARAHPGATFYVMSNAVRAAQFDRLVGNEDLRARMFPIQEWTHAPAGAMPAEAERFAIVDEETFGWDSSRPFPRAQAVPACWSELEILRSEPRGLGVLLLQTGAAFPGLSGTIVGQRLRGMSVPKPARVYRLPAGVC
jgi:hypothetical protein